MPQFCRSFLLAFFIIIRYNYADIIYTREVTKDICHFQFSTLLQG